MELLDAIKTRRSIREFTGKRIRGEDIEKIRLKAIRKGGNLY